MEAASLNRFLWTLLPWVAGSCLTGGGVVLLRSLLTGELLRGTLLAQRVDARLRRLALQLSFTRSPLSVTWIWGIEVGIALFGVLASACFGPLWLCVLLGCLLPTQVLSWKRRSRVKKLEQQVEGFLGALARALQASPSLGEALDASALACRAPMSEEIELVLKEMSLGRSLDRALAAWTERVGSRTLSLAVSTLLVGRETGGALPEVLSTAARSLREIERLEGVLRTRTAEGRAQAWVISVLPVPLYAAILSVDENFFRALETTPVGHVVVVLAVLLWVCAIFIARKILSVRV